MIHWWTSGGESAAVKVFADQYTKAGGTWVDTAIAGGANARTAAINRTVGGTPPVMMQFNTGKQFDELVENGLLNDVEAIATEQKWKDKIPGPILAAATRNGKMFAVPVNIHGQNWLFYNTDVLKKVGAEEPKNWDEVIAIHGQGQGRRADPARLQRPEDLGAQSVQRRHARAGRPEALAGGLRRQGPGGGEERRVQERRRDLRQVARLSSTRARRAATGTMRPASSSRARPDSRSWATGPRASSSRPARPPARNMAAPILSKGSGGYAMGGDVFAFPKTKDPAALKAQVTLAKVLLDPETQIMFNKKKGSIPVRTDVDVSSHGRVRPKGRRR